MHEVAALPHQGLVTIDYRLRAGAVFVEAGRRHLLFDFADGGLGLGDARLEGGDARLTAAGRFLFLARLGVDAFFLVVRDARRRGWMGRRRWTRWSRRPCRDVGSGFALRPFFFSGFPSPPLPFLPIPPIL